MGPHNVTPEGNPLPMKIEARPGGRWYRDLGDDNGHFWGVVQAIKRPSLLEISGPLFMSSPVVSNLQYRLSEVDGGTLITFRHSAFGVVTDEHKQGVSKGWNHLLSRVRTKAEANRSARKYRHVPLLHLKGGADGCLRDVDERAGGSRHYQTSRQERREDKLTNDKRRENRS